eukprot:scaffold90498_cov32-Tisochrysis_lutea.AAC.1
MRLVVCSVDGKLSASGEDSGERCMAGEPAAEACACACAAMMSSGAGGAPVLLLGRMKRCAVASFSCFAALERSDSLLAREVEHERKAGEACWEDPRRKMADGVSPVPPASTRLVLPISSSASDPTSGGSA